MMGMNYEDGQVFNLFTFLEIVWASFVFEVRQPLGEKIVNLFRKLVQRKRIEFKEKLLFVVEKKHPNSIFYREDDPCLAAN